MRIDGKKKSRKSTVGKYVRETNEKEARGLTQQHGELFTGGRESHLR